MASDRIRPLTLETFPAWGALAKKHDGAMFEKAGFTFERHLGKRKTVMRRTVLPVLG